MKMNTKYIFGITKFLLDFKLGLKYFRELSIHFGFFRAIKEINIYRKSPKSSFQYFPNRYIKNGSNYFAIADLPPLNSPEFSEYLINEIEFVNHNAKQKLVFVIICISSRCPYKCEYCYNSSDHSNKEIISVNTIVSTIKELKKNGVRNFYLSGGEPMMRSNDIPEILQNCVDEKTGFWILTTGWKITEQDLSYYKKLGLRGIIVSLDSTNPDEVNSIKLSKNAFDIAINAIKNAKKVGLIIGIDSVFKKSMLTEDKYHEHLNFLSNLGANFINTYSPKLISNKNILFKKFELSDYKKLSELNNKYRKNNKNKKHIIPYSPDIWESKRGCVGGKNFLFINTNGDVKPCPFVQSAWGNILKENIDSILKKNNTSFRICETNKSLNFPTTYGI